MAKKIQAVVKLQCPAGAATPAPPVGTALGPHGVNIMEFVKQFNARTQSQSGMVIPCVVTIFADRTFTFITKTPPAPNLLLKEAGIEKGSGQPNRTKVGQGHPGAGQEDRRDQDGRSQRVRPRQRHEDDRRAPRDPWGWRWWTDADPGQEVQGRGRQGRPHPRVPDPRGRLAGEGHRRSPSSTRPWTSPSASGVDPRHADQVVRGTVVLPHGTGKSVRVLVITQGERVREAEAAGADFVGIEYIQKIKDGWLEST